MIVEFGDIKEMIVQFLYTVQNHYVLFVLVRPFSCGERHSELLWIFQPRLLLLSLSAVKQNYVSFLCKR